LLYLPRRPSALRKRAYRKAVPVAKNKVIAGTDHKGSPPFVNARKNKTPQTAMTSDISERLTSFSPENMACSPWLSGLHEMLFRRDLFCGSARSMSLGRV
jgi:hypothetical protein